MSKVFALATGPLLEQGVRNFNSHCLRTWHLIKPLLDAGHRLEVFTLPINSDRPETQEQAGVEEKSIEGFTYRAFRNCDDAHNLSVLDAAAREFDPDCLLGINSYPCALISRLDCPAPLWADLNGSIMFEAQPKAATDDSDHSLAYYWRMESAPLRRADRFSVVSMPQYYALFGELAAVGRLNRHTIGHPFAVSIPNAFNPFFADPANRERARLRLRGETVPADAFILLWSGGYNTWTNYDLLTHVLERAMDRCPTMHYVSTGGPIYGHNMTSYASFREAAERGPFRDRFHFLGWIDAADLPAVYAEADLGLCVDADNVETIFGARNRLTNMAAAGVPLIVTEGPEISCELVRESCALGVPVDDAVDLLVCLVEAVNNRDALKALGERARRYALEHFTYERTTRALREWVAAPIHAPDNAIKLPRATGGRRLIDIALNPIEERIIAEDKAADSADEPARRGGIRKLLRDIVGDRVYRKLRSIRRRT